MGKGYRGKPCVYCAVDGASTTADHVLAREFVPPEYRGNLPKVAACRSCNNTKAKLEHYLTAVLPFGARHDDSSAILNTMVPPRLANNAKLHSVLSQRQGRAWVRRNGVIESAMTIPLEADQLSSLFKYVVRGLAAYHWNQTIPADYYVGAGVLTNAGEKIVGPLLGGNGRARVSTSLGNGALDYHGSQAVDDPNLTVWCFQMYGGVTLGGDPNAIDEASSRIWAISARHRLHELFGE